MRTRDNPPCRLTGVRYRHAAPHLSQANEAAMKKTQQTLDEALATAVDGVNSDISSLENKLKNTQDSVTKVTSDLGKQDAKLDQLRSSVVNQLQAKIDEVAKQAQVSVDALYGQFSCKF